MNVSIMSLQNEEKINHEFTDVRKDKHNTLFLCRTEKMIWSVLLDLFILKGKTYKVNSDLIKTLT